MITSIELTETTRANVIKLLSTLYDEPSTNDGILTRFLALINADLTDEEISVLVLKYGLDGSALKTLEEVDKELGIGREKIRQIEARTFRMLRHPVRGRSIFGIVDEPQAWSFTLSSDLTDTNLWVRTVNALKRMGITTVSGLMNVKLADLLKERNLGQKSFQEIVDFIKANKDLR